jgi:4-amino-4-deoxy-L-arabinose transferase-like glycosyltransferase
MRLFASEARDAAGTARSAGRAWLAAAVILLGFGLRIASLGAQSLWFDEGWSWHLARLPLGEMAAVTAGDRSPPLYYALLGAWLQLAGDSELALRFPSAAADTAAVALVIALARALAGRRAALAGTLAASLWAISPLAVWYAQEARMYALMTALCLASTCALWSWLRAPLAGEPARRGPLIASAALLAAAVYCHYYAVFLLPAHGLAVVLLCLPRRTASARRALGAWAVAALAAALAAVPWLLFASPGFAYDDGFAFPLNAIDLRLAEWTTAFASGGLFRALPEGWGVVLAVSVACAAASYGLARRWPALAFLAILVAVPLLSAAVAVRLFYPYRSVFHPRYLMYAAPALCILLGGADAPAGTRRAARVLVPLLGSASVLGMAWLWLPALAANYADPAVARDDARAAARHVVEALEPGDAVIMARDNYALRYYYPRFMAGRPVTGTQLAAFPEGLHGFLSDGRVVEAFLDRARPERVRLFLWQDDVVDPQRLVESALWMRGYQIGEYNFGQIRLPLYRVRPPEAAAAAWAPVTATFGDQLDLTGYWTPASGHAGDWFYAILEWSPRRALSADYKVFVHVVDRDGQARFQSDTQPLNARLPMSRWTPGRPLRDAHAVVIPADLPAGEYRVLAGVYDPAAGGSRLAASGPAALPSGDMVDLGALKVDRR